jgi:hypothetical protein
MDRDYKGKRIDNGEWVCGDLISLTWLDSTKGIRYFERGSFWVIDVIPESVGQFSGKRDKYNNKIYEKDIVKTSETDEGDLIELVIFEDCSFKVKCLSSNSKINYSLGLINEELIEIIGNKIDNLELLNLMK